MSEIQIVGVATVSVPVSDQERALKFYTETLGFQKRRDAEFGSGLRWIEVAPASSTTTIALPPLGPELKSGVDTGIRLTTNNAQADHEVLRARGVDTDPEILRFPNVPPMFSFRDPDGNTLYIVESA
jgi:catechol 2,3-dioxygenase-like lactoylglutathione lyase family enzyme